MQGVGIRLLGSRVDRERDGKCRPLPRLAHIGYGPLMSREDLPDDNQAQAGSVNLRRFRLVPVPKSKLLNERVIHNQRTSLRIKQSTKCTLSEDDS